MVLQCITNAFTKMLISKISSKEQKKNIFHKILNLQFCLQLLALYSFSQFHKKYFSAFSSKIVSGKNVFMKISTKKKTNLNFLCGIHFYHYQINIGNNIYFIQCYKKRSTKMHIVIINIVFIMFE